LPTGSYNAELVKQLSAEMQRKIKGSVTLDTEVENEKSF